MEASFLFGELSHGTLSDWMVNSRDGCAATEMMARAQEGKGGFRYRQRRGDGGVPAR